MVYTMLAIIKCYISHVLIYLVHDIASSRSLAVAGSTYYCNMNKSSIAITIKSITVKLRKDRISYRLAISVSGIDHGYNKHV
jgi:hypothetical protein